jgi:predicted DNA binding CopG/RHH family protein
MVKTLPPINSDEELEAFMEGDLSEYLDGLKSYPFKFTFAPTLEDLPKTENVHIRFSKPLLESVKERASTQGMSYQKYIRRVLEASLTHPA